MSTTTPPPPLTTLLNFRDVGKTINHFTGKRLVAENILYRSARPDDISLADRHSLLTDYGIQTIIDLRTKSEHEKQAQKRAADLAALSAATSPTNDALTSPVHIPGINYLEININGPGFERVMLRRLSYWSLCKLIYLIISGARLQGISILVREVISPRGLTGLGYDTLDNCGPEIAQALHTLSTPASPYPLLYHCTQGKDRTGLLTLLLLLLLHVPVAAIAHDYSLTGPALARERPARLAEMRAMGFSDEFADAPPDWVEKMALYLDERYGGVRAYLEGIGVDEEEVGRLVRTLGAEEMLGTTSTAEAPGGPAERHV